MSRKKQEHHASPGTPKPAAFYRDGEVLGEVFSVAGPGGVLERFRTIMIYCPDSLLQEINSLSDFNYIERSDFVTVAAQQLLDYLESCKEGDLAGLIPDEPLGEGEAEDILMSRELYRYDGDEDEEWGGLCAAEDAEE